MSKSGKYIIKCLYKAIYLKLRKSEQNRIKLQRKSGAHVEEQTFLIVIND